MLRAARTYASVLLAGCVLMSLVLLYRSINAISFLFYTAVLLVIVLALYGKGGKHLSQAALTLCGLWFGGSLVYGVWLVARLSGWYAVAAATAFVAFGIVPGALCCFGVAKVARQAAEHGS